MDAKKDELQLQLGAEAQHEISAFAENLKLLPEYVAEGFRDRLLGLLDAASLDVGVTCPGAAAGARDHIICLRVAGYRELLAAAAGAAKFDG